ncbi:FMN reductase [NAD(P)H] [Peptococcaceae bacterium CEB3]|nr:FMN reductase [NAD(P)H] [Peptococcaceae bacterium CEB3]
MKENGARPSEKCLRERISLRRFADRPLNREDVDWIVEGAMRAPTAGNMMLYSMILITDPAKKQVLSETCDHQPFIAKAPLVAVFLADYQRWFDGAHNYGQWMYARKTGAQFSAEMARSVREALKNWRGEPILPKPFSKRLGRVPL